MISKKILLREMMTLSSVYMCTVLSGCSSAWSVFGTFYLLQPGHKPSATIQQCGYILSISELSKILFAIPGGILMEKIGRKPIVILIGSINILSWLFLATFQSIDAIYMARFLQGIAIGLTQIVAYPMIGEIATPQHRGMLSNLNTIAACTGQLSLSILNSVHQSYYFTQILGTVISTLFVPTIYWLTEPFAYLIQKKKYEKAKQNLKILRPHYSDEELNAEFLSIQRDVEYKESTKGQPSWLRLLKMRTVRNSIICVFLLNSAHLLSGSFIITVYIMNIQPRIDYVPISSYPLISYILDMLVSIVFSTIIEKFPRRILYISTATLSTFTLSVGTLSCYMNSYNPTYYWKWIFLIDNFVSLRCIGILGSLINTFRAEVFPSGIKGVANALCVIVRGASIACAAQIYSWIDTYSHLYVQFVIFTLVMVFSIVVAYIYLPETRGKTLAEIQVNLECGHTKSKTSNSNASTNEK